MSVPMPIAFFNQLIPLIGVSIPVLALMIPIVAIRAKHREKLAEIKARGGQYQSQNPSLAADVQALRNEVRELKEIVHAQVLVMDEKHTNMQRLMATKASPPPVPEDALRQQLQQ